MRTLKRFLLLQIGPSPWEFLLAFLVLVCGVYCFFGWPDPMYLTLGRMLPIVALFLALDAVRAWHLLPVPGRIVAALFILLLGTTVWDTLAEVAHILFSARH